MRFLGPPSRTRPARRRIFEVMHYAYGRWASPPKARCNAQAAASGPESHEVRHMAGVPILCRRTKLGGAGPSVAAATAPHGAESEAHATVAVRHVVIRPVRARPGLCTVQAHCVRSMRSIESRRRTGRRERRRRPPPALPRRGAFPRTSAVTARAAGYGSRPCPPRAAVS